MKKSPPEIAHAIAIQISNHVDIVSLKDRILSVNVKPIEDLISAAIEAERARLTLPAEEEMRKIFEEWFLSRYKESSSSLSKEVAARIASDFQFSAGFRAAFKWMEEKP